MPSDYEEIARALCFVDICPHEVRARRRRANRCFECIADALARAAEDARDEECEECAKLADEKAREAAADIEGRGVYGVRKAMFDGALATATSIALAIRSRACPDAPPSERSE